MSTKRHNAGGFLRQIRTDKNLSLANIAKELSLFPMYLSEIERGMKIPSDIVIRELAQFYELEEDHLFDKFGRIPLLLLEELEKNDGLRSTLYKIKTNKKLDDETRNQLYDRFYELYIEALNRVDKEDRRG